MHSLFVAALFAVKILYLVEITALKRIWLPEREFLSSKQERVSYEYKKSLTYLPFF